MGFINFLPLMFIFWPFLAIFGCFWAPLSPRVSGTSAEGAWRLYLPFGMAPAKKTPLILNAFHFYSFFCGIVVSGRFFTWLGPFWAFAGGKNSSKYDHIKLSLFFHPLTVRSAKNRACLAILMGFIDFHPLVVIFGNFWQFLAVFGLPWALGFLKHLNKEPNVYN